MKVPCGPGRAAGAVGVAFGNLSCGTALPVLLVAFLLAYSAKSVGKAYNMLVKTEWWARQVTGWVFVLAGVLFSLKYAFEVM